MTEQKKPRKIPITMPEKPEELLAFIAWPELYEDETVTQFSERMALCHKLAEQYAHGQAQQQAAVAHEAVKQNRRPKPNPVSSSIILPPWMNK